ncbi:MAG: RagB/SusD family nutrient uptake outer membrane protein [Balneolales bacterium]
MKRIIKYPIFLTILFLSLTSCSENFLQPEPLSFFAPENVYTDKAGFEAQLVTLRKNLTGEHSGGRGTARIPAQWIFGETHLASAFSNWNFLTPNPTSDHYDVVKGIEDKYQYIKDANVVISRINDIEWDSSEDKELILAEALWHRAYWYTRMVNSYGDVPWIGEEVTSARVDFNTHTRKAILNKIQSDMEDHVIGVLPVNVVPGAVSNGAADHLLTRIAMSNYDWDTAIAASSRLIDGGDYELITERFGVDTGNPTKNHIWDLHRPGNVHSGGNTETILATVDRYSDPEEARTSGSYAAYFYSPSWHHSRVQDSEGSQCTYRPDEAVMDTLLGAAQWDTLGQGGGSNLPNDFFQYHVWEEDGYTYQDTPDQRRREGNGNWWEVEDILCNDPSSVDYGEPAVNGSWVDGLIHNSLSSPPIYKTYHPETDGTLQGGNADMYIFRLAETYLLRAEAYFWNNQPGLAADDINKVRVRAGAEPIDANEVNIDFIFDETIRELFFETPRQNDLARVTFYLAEEGVTTEGYPSYSVDNLHNSSWAHDRVMKRNEWYEQYTGDYIGDVTKLGTTIPIADQFIYASGNYPIRFSHQWLFPIDSDFIDANTQGTINQNRGYLGADRNQPPLETIEESTTY